MFVWWTHDRLLLFDQIKSSLPNYALVSVVTRCCLNYHNYLVGILGSQSCNDWSWHCRFWPAGEIHCNFLWPTFAKNYTARRIDVFPGLWNSWGAEKSFSAASTQRIEKSDEVRWLYGRTYFLFYFLATYLFSLSLCVCQRCISLSLHLQLVFFN